MAESSPTVNAFLAELLDRAVEAARRDGVTVIVSTHDLAFVRRIADRVSLMFDGELACTEPVGEFFRNNLFYRP